LRISSGASRGKEIEAPRFRSRLLNNKEVIVPLLEGKSIIITGASSGIGLAAARIFAAEGARLVLIARREEPLQVIVREITASGGFAVACPGDVADADTHERAVEAALHSCGQLDGAFNNAGGIEVFKPLADVTAEEWERTISVNLTSCFLAARSQVPAMLRTGGGSIVFTSSFVGNSTGIPGLGAYAAAKSGIAGLVRSLTADYAHLGIRANALLAGGTDTPGGGSDENKAWAATLHPVGRIAKPEEIANAALFLISDSSSFVVGSNLWADGGNSATKLSVAA
jgi:NAD(P)-dependent dehydrogenase (short-subunit alcohol dehydrogenase family)